MKWRSPETLSQEDSDAAGGVRHLLAHAHQRPLIDTAAFETDNASITELEIANDGTIAVVSMNNTSHLSPEQTGPRLEMI